MSEEKLYVGSKIIRAYPMDEHVFKSDVKGEYVNRGEVKPGYLVKYPDGYTSWSPKETFENAYREVTDSEKDLFEPMPDFGPADSDVHDAINQAHIENSGKPVPEGWGEK